MPVSFSGIGMQVPEALLPVPQLDPTKWAVIACDQFTSQPQYWEAVESLVGKAPSTLGLILPEIYLHTPGCQERIKRIHAKMRAYLDQEILYPQQGLIYVERTLGDRVRRGLMVALDLEQYDFQPGSKSLIRATEGTIMERIPARIQVRQGAVLEVPHTLVLIDDPGHSVIEPLSQAKTRMKPLYDLDLMMGSGHLSGWLVDQPDLQTGVIQALQALVQPQAFASRYGVDLDQGVMLYAVGDGNHSCAAAKVLWDELKTRPGVSPQHPARYALVEIENLHDEALCFEPIHRVLYQTAVDMQAALCDYFHGDLEIARLDGPDEVQQMVRTVDRARENQHLFGMLSAQGMDVVSVRSPAANLTLGTLQSFLDALVNEQKVGRIDYVHGLDVVVELGSQPGNLGFYLPPIDKTELFKTVLLDGALPRKTFSMGAAREKRFYLECRKIIP